MKRESFNKVKMEGEDLQQIYPLSKFGDSTLLIKGKPLCVPGLVCAHTLELSETFLMDELVDKLAGLGVSGLILVGLVATSSYTGAVAITTSLAFLGGPFGMIGGALALTLIAGISSIIAKYGVGTLAEAVVRKLKESGRSEESIIKEINDFPLISKGLRAQLRDYARQ